MGGVDGRCGVVVSVDQGGRKRVVKKASSKKSKYIHTYVFMYLPTAMASIPYSHQIYKFNPNPI